MAFVSLKTSTAPPGGQFHPRLGRGRRFLMEKKKGAQAPQTPPTPQEWPYLGHPYEDRGTWI